jgi:hypothetical protein
LRSDGREERNAFSDASKPSSVTNERNQKMKDVRRTLFPLFFSMMILGCATVPSLRVPQPWIRSLKSSQPINTISKLKIDLSGSTVPLLGNEQLTADRIREKLSYLLKRRGFSIDISSPEYVVALLYKTERSDKFRLSSAVASTNVQAYAIVTSSGAGATSGLGVSIARAVSALATRSTTVSEQSAEQMLSYTHTISIEFRNRDGLVVWKGESTWDSDELNLINRIVPAIQLILSDLPSDRATKPEIPEVKGSHVLNYYRLECEDTWFTCPALPYRILFDTRRASAEQKSSIPRSVENPHALAAYVDLIQTAEYALPDGDEKDWKDPIKVSLWKRATLGGQYLLGPSKKPVNILIKLTGKTDGYYIDECKIASDEEFGKLSAQFSKWRQALQDYYDVYVQ